MHNQIEMARAMVKDAQMKEAFRIINGVLKKVKNAEIKNELAHTEGRFNHYQREKRQGEGSNLSELNGIMKAFLNQLDELESVIFSEREILFNELGQQIITKIEGAFLESKKRDEVEREMWKETSTGKPSSEEVMEFLDIDGILRQNFDDDRITNYIKGLKFKNASWNPIVSKNLIEIFLLLEPRPYEDHLDIIYDLDLYDSFVAGFYKMGFYLWNLSIMGGFEFMQCHDIEENEEGNYNIIVKFYTVAELPESLSRGSS